ncbi:MAG: dipeptide/oligopeptide/nickel ABC transporter permease/ATP-binding protein [Pseudonocardia sp.]
MKGPFRTGLVLLGIIAAVALAAPLLAPYDPDARSGPPFVAPSAAHWLGTNDVGQDLLSELVFGARISLLVGIVAAVAATVIGALVGLAAGYHRGWVDTVLMRGTDVVLALPVVPLTIAVGVFAGPGLVTQVAVISAVIWARVARELRAQVLSVRERDHVQAVRAMGAGAGYVLPRHVLPVVAPLVAPQFVIATKVAIGLEASLAFLGLGDVTAKSWGTTLSLAHSRSAFLTDAWLWWVLPPGLAIALTVLAFALIGYGLEERARPVLRDRPLGRRSRWVATPPVTGGPPLVVEGLSVRYGERAVVHDVSLDIAAGETVGLVGASGSGKSTVAAAVAALLPGAARVTAGRVLVDGHDVATTDPRTLRGRRVAIVPQEAMSALNPVHTVRAQIVEALTAHRRLDRDTARARADELLVDVGIDPNRGGDHPHRFSGGMRQRVVIAIALAADPVLLVADEPTSGLDVLAQDALLDLLAELPRRGGIAVLVISHDLPVVARIADRIGVMQAGHLVELGPAGQVLTEPAHPYTRTLLAAAVPMPEPVAS